MTPDDVFKGMAESAKRAMQQAKALPFPKSFRDLDFPTAEEQAEFESAAALIRRLAARIRAWQATLPADVQPVILAILPSGMAIRVQELRDEGHHGVLVHGRLIDSETDCMLLLHQSQLQLLCYLEQVDDEQQRVPIGFRIGDTEVSG